MYDYSKDKRGWVNFKWNKKKKVKLRRYIDDLAKQISKVNNQPRTYNRDKLIEYYNKDGIPGINRSATVLLAEVTEKA